MAGAGGRAVAGRRARGAWRTVAEARACEPRSDPILLVHGGGYDAAAISWYRLIGPLAAQRRVIAPDLPGCGGTTGVALPGAPSAAADQLVHDPATLPPEAVAEFFAEARRPDGGVAYGSYNRATVGPRGMLNDKSGVVGSIHLPALFFHGRQDGLVSIDGSRRAVAAMPNARLVEVYACGHWAQLEQHDRLLSELTAFLAEVDAAPH